MNKAETWFKTNHDIEERHVIQVEFCCQSGTA